MVSQLTRPDHEGRERGMIPVRSMRLSERGASSVEYALILTAIAAVIVLVVFALGGAVQGLFSDTCTRIAGQVSVPSSC